MRCIKISEPQIWLIFTNFSSKELFFVALILAFVLTHAPLSLHHNSDWYTLAAQVYVNLSYVATDWWEKLYYIYSVQLGGLDVECSRNKHGRQLLSFESPVTLHNDAIISGGNNNEHKEDRRCRGVFIRAPGISKVTSDQVEVLGTLEPSGEVVAVRQGHLIATSFHPELTSDLRWHLYFVKELLKSLKQNEWIMITFSLSKYSIVAIYLTFQL